MHLGAETMQRIALDAALLPQAQALSDEAGWNQNTADWLIFQRYGEIFGVVAGERLVATAAVLPYGASTITTSESSIAVILATATSLMAAPSRALILRPLTSTAPEAGTR